MASIAKGTGADGETVKAVTDAGSSIWGLSVQGVNIIRAIKESKRGIREIKAKVHSLGLVYPDEQREALIASGIIPLQYARGTIVETLKDGKLPAGWTAANARQQGFEKWLNEGRETARVIDGLKKTASRRSIVRSI